MSDDSDDDWELAAKALETLQVDDDVLEIAIGRAVKENANNAFDGLLDDDDDREMQREVKTDSQRKTTIKAATTSSASCAVEIFSKMLGNFLPASTQNLPLRKETPTGAQVRTPQEPPWVLWLDTLAWLHSHPVE